VLSPAFVADCLETLYEITEEYLELFQEHGGEVLQLVPSLNSNDTWVDAVSEIVQQA
jgi:ferrochelatase